MRRTLVGGVGYFNLCDFSIGPALSAALEAETWPVGIVVEDLSYGPVIVCHRLGEERPPFERWVLGGAVRRGRPPGTITAYRWDRVLPDVEQVQARVSEAVAGVIDMENLVIVAAALGAAPPETCIVEVEPLIEEFGDTLSPPLAGAFEPLVARMRGIATGEHALLPVAPLGG